MAQLSDTLLRPALPCPRPAEMSDRDQMKGMTGVRNAGIPTPADWSSSEPAQVSDRVVPMGDDNCGTNCFQQEVEDTLRRDSAAEFCSVGSFDANDVGFETLYGRGGTG